MERIINAIPAMEWARARTLFGIGSSDERSGLGQVRLVSDGTWRRWYASDSIRAACLRGDRDSRLYDVGVPAALLRYSAGATSADNELELVVDRGAGTLTLRADGSAIRVEDLAYSFPDLEQLKPRHEEMAGSAIIRWRDLHNAVSATWQARNADLDNDEPPVIWLEIGDGTVGCGAVNRSASDATVEVHCDAHGQVAVQVDAQLLTSVIEIFPPDEELTLGIPRQADRAVVLEGAEMWGMVMTIRHPSSVIRQTVEEVIGNVMGYLAVRRDADGDYPLVRHSTPVYARLLIDEQPPILQVFAIALRDVPGTPELMAELNDLNTNGTFARVIHVGEQVLVEVDLVAETLDATELRTAIERVLDLRHRIMPMLSAVFGGELVTDPALERRAYYRTTIVEAEVSPGALTALNGPLSDDTWPFQGTVHVITGWDPQGVTFRPDENEHVNNQIAMSILEAGGRFVHGHGRSPSGDHIEPSLIAWGLTRDDAVTIGRRASQDAIFEIDADNVHLISCLGDNADETWPRRQ